MELESVIEVVRIKQEVREVEFPYLGYVVGSPEEAAEVAQCYIGDEDREVVLVMMLNTKHEVIGLHRAHVGTLNSSVLHVRDIYKCAILNNACSILLAHNHPSNVCRASSEDIRVTQQLEEAGMILGIPLLDHIIVGRDSFTSLKEAGILS
ncbi:JAB domain-containing protein [Priestia endophytica]|uniref:DNA repair protein RadC n=1 Tax=Priestia endophytica DSM 13796 TaxID=1121089 RepID=A0A1I6C7D7_9BACI|nr:JAB domain-containing protein [Priestia endophytica]KYG33483.1 hypothetical protein AZF06_21815 [Priestia endophytica]SFQ89100.1 DNA repair protein RadC [Priestia endophytica DSM 13796]